MKRVPMPKQRSRNISRFFITASGATHALATCPLQCLLKPSNICRPPETGVSIIDSTPQGVDVEHVQIWRSGQKRGVTRELKAMIRRRSAIEPTIGHMKSDGKLDRNWLKGALGDALNAVLCGAGHNLRLIINKLKVACQPI